MGMERTGVSVPRRTLFLLSSIPFLFSHSVLSPSIEESVRCAMELRFGPGPKDVEYPDGTGKDYIQLASDGPESLEFDGIFSVTL
jgi:hypothetical protein